MDGNVTRIPDGRRRDHRGGGVQDSVASSAMLVASERADKEHGLGIDDIDLFEVNDALASVDLA
ncbi:MAG: hypothetical protein ACXWDI_01760 [Nocardioides sp.]